VLRRLSFYVAIHAFMQASIPSEKSASMVFAYGTATLNALSLFPFSQLPYVEEAESMVSQIVYAYALAVEGVLDSLRSSRTFGIFALAALVATPVFSNFAQHRLKAGDVFAQALNLVAFDLFTSSFFVETGDDFADMCYVIFFYILLSITQTRTSALQSSQQYVTWRCANEIFSELVEMSTPKSSVLAVSIFVLTCIQLLLNFDVLPSLHTTLRWITPLMFLLAVNVLIDLLQSYLSTMSSLDSLPVLLCISVVTTFALQQSHAWSAPKTLSTSNK
jgi:hypothetical protein